MTDEEKQMGRKIMAGLMKRMLQHSSINVPQPLPLIEETAKKRLSTDGLISWKIILKEWEKVSLADKKIISKLLILNSHDLVETFDVTSDLLEDHKATAEFINQHPEYGKSKEEIKSEMLTDSFEDLLG